MRDRFAERRLWWGLSFAVLDFCCVGLSLCWTFAVNGEKHSGIRVVAVTIAAVTIAAVTIAAVTKASGDQGKR
ncbi:MAG: hypothetical protein ACK5R1_09410 [Planctomycetota bacterium]